MDALLTGLLPLVALVAYLCGRWDGGRRARQRMLRLLDRLLETHARMGGEP